MRSALLLPLLLPLAALAQDRATASKQPLSVLYLGNSGTERARSYLGFLSEQFGNANALPRSGFVAAQAEDADVVLLDWSQQDVDLGKMGAIESPLGPRDAWRKPLVLLGSAGLLLAGPWQLTGSYG